MGSCAECVSSCSCPLLMGRRTFLTSLGASAAALKMGVLDFASSVMADTPQPAAKPRVRAFFMRPKSQDAYWMSWPGQTYDTKARQADYTRVLTEAAASQGVQVEIQQDPLEDMAAVNGLLAQLKQAPCDGVILTLMHMQWWPMVNHFVAAKGVLPTVVFSPMGTCFTGHLGPTRSAPKTFVASTQDYGWLAHAVKMFKTMWQMKKTRICVIAGDKEHEQVLPTVGTTLHHIPLNRWPDQLQKTDTTDEMKAIADYYSKEAKGIVEPKPQDVLNAAKNYVMAKRIMEAEKCQGITMNCLGLVGARRIPCPPCIAWARLLDENRVGCCEADIMAAISLLLTGLLLDRPGFIQDPVPDTVKNSFMGAHCTSPMKLAGFDKPHEPFLLRNHSESGIGCVPQVVFRIGEPITVMKFNSPDSMIAGTGRVIGNIETPPSGGCRTSVDLEMDGIADSRDVKGFHQLFIYGKHVNTLRAYGQLAGIKVEPV
jgi:hypothetical protein